MTPSDHVRLAKDVARKYRIPGLTRGDVEGEATLALYTTLPRYDPIEHGPSLSGYLFFQIRSRLNSLLRKQTLLYQRRPLLTDLSPEDPHRDAWGDAQDGVVAVDKDPGPDQSAMNAELLDSLRDVTSPAEAKVVEATYWHDSCDEDIADLLGVSVRTVQKYRANAIHKIRVSGVVSR